MMMTTTSTSSNLLDNNNNNNNNAKKSVQFRIVHHESGQIEKNLPIFEALPHVASQLLDNDINNDNEEKQLCNISSPNNDNDIIEVENYRDGVFVIQNVLTKEECQRFIDLSESMGYTPDAPVSLGRNIRHNENCVWMMNANINQQIFNRIQHLVPQSILFRDDVPNIGPPISLNQRWRLYKYNPNDVFKAHTDGAWAGSGINPETGEYIQDIYDGTALSWLTFLIYLNDDFEGGSTKFPITHNNNNDEQNLFGDDNNHNNNKNHQKSSSYFEVQPKQGSVLCFYHGYHPLSKLHEGSLVTNGTKYVARTEVLYTLPPELQQ